MYHAKLSPSSAARWTECTASINAQEGLPDTTSEASRQGTACHQLCAEVLEHNGEVQSYLGREMWFVGREEYWREEWPHTDVAPEHVVKMTEEMLDACDTAVEFVREQVRLTGGQLEVEQRVPIGHFTGEEGAGGTSDVVIITPHTIYVYDFKFGRHKVEAFDVVEPARGDQPPVRRANLQAACYALGSMEKFDWLYDFKHVHMGIIQPHLNHVSEYSCSVDELLQVRDFLQVKAEETRTNPQFKPSRDACHFCKASGNCEAQTKMVVETALIGFGDATPEPAPVAVSRLGQLYALVPMIQDWCKAIGDRVYEELNAGRPVVRDDGLAYTLVTGRKGNRQWDDEADIEATLKHFRLRKDEMYNLKLKSPADLEKMAKVKKGGPPPIINSQQWKLLQSRITQSEGGKSIALETDTRPKLPSSAEGFVDVAADDCSDLLG